jgi:hypothetical protein
MWNTANTAAQQITAFQGSPAVFQHRYPRPATRIQAALFIPLSAFTTQAILAGMFILLPMFAEAMAATARE